MKTLKRVYDVFSLAERYFLFIVFFFATIMVVINVFGRKIFGFSFNWLEELNRYILITCTFIGAAIAVTDDLHPKMDSIVGLFKGRLRRVIELISVTLFTTFMYVMVYFAFQQLGKMTMISAMTATLGVPVYVFFAFIPLGFLGMAIRSSIKVIFSVLEVINYKGETSSVEKQEESK